MPTVGAIRKMALTYAEEASPGTTFKASETWVYGFLKQEGMEAGCDWRMPTSAKEQLLAWLSQVRTYDTLHRSEID